MPRLMSVDKLQEAEEHVAQMREEAARKEAEARTADLRQAPVADTAGKPHRMITAPLDQVRAMSNMRTGALEDVHELAVSIRETGLLHPPLVRATDEDEQPYELLAGQRSATRPWRSSTMPRARLAEWRFTLIDGISRREALTMQFAENFHQRKPEPVQFARAARLIMAEDPSLTAAEVSRIVGAPAAWTRKALRLLELPEAIVERVERGDLSFTAADFVRRGLARGDVTPETAEDLVGRLLDGALSASELKFGVGYVPPPPERYEETSARLDAARPGGGASPARGTRRRRAPSPPYHRRASRPRPHETPRWTATCSAPSSFTRRPTAPASCCGSRARPTRTSTPAHCTRTSAWPLCAHSRARRSKRPDISRRMATLNDPGISELLAKPNHAVLSTVNKDGSVHSAVVWLNTEDDKLALNSARGRAWPTNLTRDPRATLLAAQRGQPVRVRRDPGPTSRRPTAPTTHIDTLAQKYINQEQYPWRVEGEERVKFHVTPERVRHAQGLSHSSSSRLTSSARS